MGRTWTQPELNDARVALAELYASGKTARRVVIEADLAGRGSLDFSGDARTMWFEILEELNKHQVVGTLVAFACQEYPNHETLQRLQAGGAVHVASTTAPSKHATPSPPAMSGIASSAGPIPGGTYTPSWHVPRPRLESLARGCLAAAGSPLTLIGPAAMGKTWLTEYLLAEVRAARGGTIARVNLRQVSQDDRGSFPAFSAALLRLMGKAHRLSERADQLAADARLTPMMRVTELLEAALSAADGAVYLVLDVPDELLTWASWRDIDGLLRSWNELAADEPWDRLRILLVLSTSPSIVTRGVLGSPFRTTPVRVGDLDDDEVSALAQRHGIALTAEDRTLVAAHVGGHPMLLSAVLRGMKVDRLDARAACRPDVNCALHDALPAAAPRLRDHPELLDLLRAIAKAPGAPIATAQRRDAEALGSAGLLRVEGAGYSLRLPVFNHLLR